LIFNNLGGLIAPNSKDSVEIFDGVSWRPFYPPLPYKIHGHCMILVNETTLLIAGGSQVLLSFKKHLNV